MESPVTEMTSPAEMGGYDLLEDETTAADSQASPKRAADLTFQDMMAMTKVTQAHLHACCL